MAEGMGSIVAEAGIGKGERELGCYEARRG
jgi:hypothetical protein